MKLFSSYKSTTITLILMYGLVVLTISYIHYFSNKLNTPNQLDKGHYENIVAKKQALLNEFIENYSASSNSISGNDDLLKMLKTSSRYMQATHWLASIMLSVNGLIDVQILDLNGKQLTHLKRIQTIHSGSNSSKVEVTPREKLGVAHTSLINLLVNGKTNAIHFETNRVNNLENNLEYRKNQMITLTRKLSLNNAPYGFLSLTFDISSFFKVFTDSNLYELFLFNDNKNLIIASENYDQDAISSYFNEEELNSIFNQDVYLGDNFYSTVFEPTHSNQGYKLVIKSKAQPPAFKHEHNAFILIISIGLITLLMLPLGFRLSKEPDKLLQQLHKKIYTDETTGLPNETSLESNLKRFPSSSLIIVSIDNFDNFQYLYGDSVIDDVLNQLTGFLLRKNKQNQMALFYLGMGNFALTFSKLNKKELEKSLSSFHQLIEEQTFLVEKDIQLSLSITLGLGNEMGQQNKPSQTLTEAMISLSNARKLCYPYLLSDTSFLVDNEKTLHERMQILELIRNAVLEDKVVVHFQPIMNASSKQISKYEALVRISSNAEDLLYPNQFLSLAKTTKYYTQITQLMIRKVISTLKQFDANTCISINLSMLDIIHKEVIEYLVYQAKLNNVVDCITIEMIESDDFGDFKSAYECLKELHDIGFKVAIDDFGSGYSNFQNLIKLKSCTNYLKIDGSIVRNIATDPTAEQLFKTIIDFANSLNFKTIAEFIHDEATLNIATKYGVNYLQGYHIGKPEPFSKELS